MCNVTRTGTKCSRWRGMLGYGNRAVQCVLLVLLLTSAKDGFALPRGLSYSVAPTVDYIMWDDELGLEDIAVYGGRLSLNFGRLVSLQGHYFTNDKVDTDLRSIRYSGQPIAFDHDQRLGVSRYGADMMLSLGLGQDFVPFIKVGGGVLHLTPDEGRNFDAIALSAGGGLRFAFLDRFQAQVHVEDVIFRMDRGNLMPDPSPVIYGVDPERDEIRHNLTVGGGIIFNLGGHPSDRESDIDRAIRSRYEGGLFGASWPVEFYVGNLKFDNAAGLEDQTLAGVRTGLNFGQLVGLRGYYWRGIDDDFGAFEDVQSYGGEAQFNLNTGQGAIPYLLLGAGQLDFLSEYRDETGDEREDRTMLIGGGGLGFTLGRHLRVNAAVRDYIFTESANSQLAVPGELLHNWSYSAGLTFLFGGKQADKGDVDALGRERWTPSTPPAQRSDDDRDNDDGDYDYRYDYENYGPDDRGPSERRFRFRDHDRRNKPEYILLPDSLLPRNFKSNEVIAIPVPEVGEIYIRYGQPGGVSIQSHPSTPSTEKTDSAKPTPTMSDADRIEMLSRELEERLGDRLEKRIDERLKSLAPATPGTAPQTIVVPPSSSTTIVQGADGAEVKTHDPKVFHTFAGVQVDEPTQAILGLRLDIGSIAKNRSLRFIPELAFGFMNEGSFLIVANAMYNFGPIPGTDRIAPYAFTGLGLIRFGEGVDRDRTEGVINLGYGISKPIGNWVGFIEHQGIDLFSLNRINAGIRWIKK